MRGFSIMWPDGRTRVALLSPLGRRLVGRGSPALSGLRRGTLGERDPGVQGILDATAACARPPRTRAAARLLGPAGGFLHETEGAEDGLRREFREETGLEIEPVRLLRIDIEPYGGRTVFSVTWVVSGDG